ncbi:MAG TPA: glycosyltransferase family 4 protein [Candidatus Saccharimonadales bacterium]|jgi:phosphatidylinositol alpha-mannosyltransferase|nr:glycosyltransferase family 4 protein [Candidatus Saccharimonadales bacterium]
MKIGLVCPYSIAKGGGVQEIVYAMQVELNKRGHDAYIITPRPQDHELEPRDKMIFVGSAADFNSPLHTTIQVSASVNDTIQNMLEEHQFDILHFHEPWVPMLSMQILSRSTTVNVGTFHAKLPETMMSRTMAKVVTPYTKPILKYIDAFTAPSDAAAEYLCSLTDAPVAIIPNAIDHRFTPPKVVKDNRKHKTILYVGRLEGRKGVNYLLHAFQKLSERRPDVSLVIAGDGADRNKLENLAADLELKNVEFRGYVTDDEKIKLLRDSDLFCAPAIYGESFGIVLIEAMACGLVTVAGDNSGYKSVMKGLGAVSLVNPRHGDEFGRRLELLLYETDLRKLWREWAAAEIPQYSYEHVVDQYVKVYKDAIAAKRREG